MTYWKPLVIAPALVITSAQCFAVTYLTVEQAQKVIFPGASFSPLNLPLTPAQKRAIEKASAVRLRKPPQGLAGQRAAAGSSSMKSSANMNSSLSLLA